MKWDKAPDSLKAAIDALMKDVDCQRRPMFGYPAYFINAHMFAGLFEDKLFLRLSPPQQADLGRTHGPLQNLEPMPGRAMKDYFVLPRGLYENSKLMQPILREAAVYCRSLPPKEKKPPRPGRR